MSLSAHAVLSFKLRASASNTSTLVWVDETAPDKAPKHAPIEGATLCCRIIAAHCFAVMGCSSSIPCGVDICQVSGGTICEGGGCKVPVRICAIVPSNFDWIADTCAVSSALARAWT